jgi:acyl-CoA synthetase (AMP-forming)/AMP-acid ligase II
MFHAGPSLLRGLLPYLRRTYSSFSAFARVRHASSGGDTVPPELLESLKEVFTNAEIFVIYGCSEISCLGTTYADPRERRITTTCSFGCSTRRGRGSRPVSSARSTLRARASLKAT